MVYLRDVEILEVHPDREPVLQEMEYFVASCPDGIPLASHLDRETRLYRTFAIVGSDCMDVHEFVFGNDAVYVEQVIQEHGENLSLSHPRPSEDAMNTYAHTFVRKIFDDIPMNPYPTPVRISHLLPYW